MLLFFSGLATLIGMGAVQIPQLSFNFNDLLIGFLILSIITIMSYGFAWRDYVIRYSSRDLYRKGFGYWIPKDPDDYDVRD
jgi:hypothetical protein